MCKDCNGSQVCEHGKYKRVCRECNGKDICKHNKRKHYCKDCNGGSICKHNRERTTCKDCNPQRYFIKLQRTRLWSLFNKSTLIKDKHTIEYLGCTEQEFYDYITSKLTSEMREKGFHLDHIKPISKFNLNDVNEIKKCCHYTNIQPLLGIDNLIKGNKWTEEDELNWNTN